MKKLTIGTITVLLAGQLAFAQHVAEFRGADSKYAYLDWTWSSSKKVASDMSYVRAPGDNEFNLGMGYTLKPAKSLTLIPVAYFVIKKEGADTGLKLALIVNYEKAGWKVNGFIAPTRSDNFPLTRYWIRWI